MSNSKNVTVQDTLYNLDSIVSGIEQLAKSVQERKDLALSDEHLSGLIEGVFTSNPEIFGKLVTLIIQKIGQSTILRGIARETEGVIKAQVETFLSERLTDEKLIPTLNKLISMHANGEPLVFEPEQPKLLTIEDCLPLDSMEKVTRSMEILAGENAIF
jgi:hypothetical protein